MRLAQRLLGLDYEVEFAADIKDYLESTRPSNGEPYSEAESR